MKTTLSVYDFRDQFLKVRPDNFSYDGLTAIFDYLEQCEEDCGIEPEFDPIAICCDFQEGTIEEILEQYGLNNPGDNEYSLNELQDNTTVIYVDDLSSYSVYNEHEDKDKRIIIQNY